MKVIETRNEITNPVFEIEKTKDDSNNNDIIVDSKKKKPTARQKIDYNYISDKDISFLKLVGCRGIIILFGITVLVGMHLYAFSVYTQTRYIPILAFFMISAIFNCIVILFLLLQFSCTSSILYLSYCLIVDQFCLSCLRFSSLSTFVCCDMPQFAGQWHNNLMRFRVEVDKFGF